MQEKTSDLLKFSIKLAKEAAAILKRAKKKTKIVKYKELGDFALDADYLSEGHIIKRIKKKYPGHAILTEETGRHSKKSDYLWVIDPLEGTLNYAHNIPLYAVNVAVFHKGQPLVGVIYAPHLKELFYAAKGKGAFLNGRRIRVNRDKEVMKSFYSGNVKHFCEFNISRHLLRSFGNSGIELAYVACGRFGARIKVAGQDPYGYAAGSILVTEAGGKLTDMKGKPWHLKSDGALASNGKLHDKLIKIFAK